MKSTSETLYQYRRGLDVAHRRKRVLQLAAQGIETPVIAERLGMSRNSVGDILREARQASGGEMRQRG
ncbi:helix-turn-helix domain-containing protein [Rhodoplanes roseus]|uniref:Helix-turn-helix domain-containing protein n=1 Tax=Rhodoplanes roseus TaxID=29409 RepID=A0A327L2L3_9BRAD|nr:helix-turn-helix domain-containing protein [Rhodoplanes roseus]RAI44721.1 hypothetical protein CH341_07850 [Rhodoplanes roseus]